MIFRSIDRFLCKCCEMLTEVVHSLCVERSSPASGDVREGAICYDGPGSCCLGPEKGRHLSDSSIAGLVGSVDDK